MATPYTVVSGDTLTKIAQKFQKPSWKSIYYAPENADFRRKRPNPDLIYPGDSLLIPDLESTQPPIGGDILPVKVAPPDISVVTDGNWAYVYMTASNIKMRLWKRYEGQIDAWEYVRPRKGFNQIMAEIRGRIGDGVIVQGGFQNNEKPNYYIGKVIISWIWDKVTKLDEDPASRAFLSFFDASGKSPSGNFNFGIGTPPMCDSALGGLIPIIMKGKPSPRSSKPWRDCLSRGPGCGKTYVAQRSSDNLLLIGAQEDDPSSATNCRTVDQVQDDLMLRKFNDAVFLDGSDSILLDLPGKRKPKPSWWKENVNQTFLSFVSRSGSPPDVAKSWWDLLTT